MCEDGYFLDDQEKCVACGVNSCKICKGLDNTCTECKGDLFLKEGN